MAQPEYANAGTRIRFVGSAEGAIEWYREIATSNRTAGLPFTQIVKHPKDHIKFPCEITTTITRHLHSGHYYYEHRFQSKAVPAVADEPLPLVPYEYMSSDITEPPGGMPMKRTLDDCVIQGPILLRSKEEFYAYCGSCGDAPEKWPAQYPVLVVTHTVSRRVSQPISTTQPNGNANITISVTLMVAQESCEHVYVYLPEVPGYTWRYRADALEMVHTGLQSEHPDTNRRKTIG